MPPNGKFATTSMVQLKNIVTFLMLESSIVIQSDNAYQTQPGVLVELFIFSF